MILAFIEFCGLLAVAFMLNVFLYSDSLTDPRDTESLEHFTPLRLNGGGDISPMESSSEKSEGNCSPFVSNLILEDPSSDIESVFDGGGPGSDVDNSLLEGDIRDILFEAGYTRESIENVVASRLEMDLDKPLDAGEISESDTSESEHDTENAFDMLRQIRVKNVNKVMIGTLNINSLANKFDQLREIIGKNLDILTIQETKLDGSFPPQQFILDGYSEPYRLDRNGD